MYIREYNQKTERINMICDKCGEVVAEYICNESGVPCIVAYDDRENHICTKEEGVSDEI